MLKKRVKLLLGISIVLLGIILIINDNEKPCQENTNYIKQKNITTETKVKRIKLIKHNNYESYIYIPKINLSHPLVDINSIYNNVNYNIQTIKYEDPSKNLSTIVLAAHSGTSKVSYFKDIYKLSINDRIILYINKEKYLYKIIKKYQIKKTGELTIHNIDKQLVLTTCSMKNHKKQIVIISKQY